jgi:hypothetical protein
MMLVASYSRKARHLPHHKIKKEKKSKVSSHQKKERKEKKSKASSHKK